MRFNESLMSISHGLIMTGKSLSSLFYINCNVFYFSIKTSHMALNLTYFKQFLGLFWVELFLKDTYILTRIMQFTNCHGTRRQLGLLLR